MKTLTILILVLFTTPLNAKLSLFNNEVQVKCSGISELLIKKSMIELHRLEGAACESIFTNSLIDMCDKLDCEAITEIYRESTRSNRGKVIGEEE